MAESSGISTYRFVRNGWRDKAQLGMVSRGGRICLERGERSPQKSTDLKEKAPRAVDFREDHSPRSKQILPPKVQLAHDNFTINYIECFRSGEERHSGFHGAWWHYDYNEETMLGTFTMQFSITGDATKMTQIVLKQDVPKQPIWCTDWGAAGGFKGNGHAQMWPLDVKTP